MALTSMESAVIGSCQLTILLNNNLYENVTVGILKNLCSDIILGHDFQRQHKNLTFQLGGTKPDLVITTPKVSALPKQVENHPISTAPSSTPENHLESTAQHIKPVPTEGLPPKFADVASPSLFKNLPDDLKPILTKSRSFNKDDRAFIKKKLDSLLKAGLVQRSDSAWRAQVLVAKDEYNRHRKRLCIDYSQTVNLHTNLDAYPLPRIDEMVNKLSKYKYFSTYDLKSAYHQVPLLES